MTREETIVFLRDVLGWSFRKIGRAYEISHTGARKIYLKFRPKFNLEEVMEYMKD